MKDSYLEKDVYVDEACTELVTIQSPLHTWNGVLFDAEGKRAKGPHGEMNEVSGHVAFGRYACYLTARLTGAHWILNDQSRDRYVRFKEAYSEFLHKTRG